jgi:hypothetical protein
MNLALQRRAHQLSPQKTHSSPKQPQLLPQREGWHECHRQVATSQGTDRKQAAPHSQPRAHNDRHTNVASDRYKAHPTLYTLHIVHIKALFTAWSAGVAGQSSVITHVHPYWPNPTCPAYSTECTVPGGVRHAAPLECLKVPSYVQMRSTDAATGAVQCAPPGMAATPYKNAGLH